MERSASNFTRAPSLQRPTGTRCQQIRESSVLTATTKKAAPVDSQERRPCISKFATAPSLQRPKRTHCQQIHESSIFAATHRNTLAAGSHQTEKQIRVGSVLSATHRNAPPETKHPQPQWAVTTHPLTHTLILSLRNTPWPNS